MISPLKKTALDGLLAAEILWDIEALLGRQNFDQLDLEALEAEVRRQVLPLAGHAVEQRLNADHSDAATPLARCECGQLARYTGRREKTFVSVLGPLKLKRAYFHCAACGQGFCPRDRQLGLQATSLSPAVTRMVAAAGALVSFEEGSQLLAELAGVSVDANHVQRAAETLGGEIAEQEKHEAAAETDLPLPSTLYLGLDGTGVPMRASELRGRPGKQPDGSSKTREVKLCTVWSAEARDARDRPVRDEASVTYTAAIESAATLDTHEVPAAFTQRVLREAGRRRFTAADRMVVLGDGASWIWKIAQELFPRATQIVDRFHVKQHLSELAGALYGAGSKQARDWAQRRHEELDSGRIPDLLRAVRRHADHSDEARKCLQYIHRNRDRMKYPAFEAQGFCTSTGVVEAVGTCLKRAGMHWTTAGANAIIALRCCRLSGRFQGLGSSCRPESRMNTLLATTFQSCTHGHTDTSPWCSGDILLSPTMRLRSLRRSVPVAALSLVLCSSALANGPVRIWQQDLTIPTYLAGAPEPNPIFYTGRTYQGAKGPVYPYPLYDKLADIKQNKVYKAVYLENEYLKICVLPEIGGRIFEAVDKTNGYNFFYKQSVIKPALIGMVGAWISGGVEWNIPHHHRASSFMPVQYHVQESPDGSKTVWVGEMEIRHRMKWTIGMTLRPGRSYIETTVKVMNRTELPHTLLYFANVAVHTNDQYQILFPPGTQFATQHAKREFSRWPIADGVYAGVDFTSGVDVSMWKNHPNSISMFAWNYEDDFLAGYDHGKQAGTMHVADHHIVPGKKFFAWGTGPSGRMWDRILSDNDGPYLELMVGAYSDNQPDYSWIQPHEVKTFKQYWYPFQKTGGVKNASLDAAVNLEIKNGQIQTALHATRPFENAVAKLTARGREIWTQTIEISPDKPFSISVPMPADVREADLRASLSVNGRELIAYSPVKLDRNPLPEPVMPPDPPSSIKTNEELYLNGLRLEQFHSPALEPYPYYEEALKRDAGDSRVNTALGILYLKRGMFAEAEKHLRRAADRLTRNYTSPKDGEAFYYLGVALKAQDKLGDAFTTFHKAAWSAAWLGPSWYSLGEIAAARRDWHQSLEFLDRAISANGHDSRAKNLKASVLRRLDRRAEAERTIAEVLAFDPLDVRALYESGAKNFASLLRDHPATGLEVAVEYGNAGLWDDAIALLKQAPPLPLAAYYMGYAEEKRGRTPQALEHYRSAAAMPPEYVFPFQAESIAVLRAAMKANPKDARAPYYLATLLYDWQPEEAVRLWEMSRMLNPEFPIVHRNLALAYSRTEQGYAAAIASLEKAISVKPDPLHLFELDRLYEITGVPIAKRLSVLDRHKETASYRDDTLSREIALRIHAGQLDEAIDLLANRHFHSWEGGARFNVRDSWTDAHLLRGHKAADSTKALANYMAALEFPEGLEAAKGYRGGRGAEVLYWIGKAHAAAGDKAKAAEAWQQSSAQLAGSEDDPEITVGNAAQLYYQAASLEALGRKDRAAGIFKTMLAVGTKAMTARPASDFFAKFGDRETERARAAQANYVIGLALSGMGNKQKAAEHFRKAVELNPAHLHAREAATRIE